MRAWSSKPIQHFQFPWRTWMISLICVWSLPWWCCSPSLLWECCSPTFLTSVSYSKAVNKYLSEWIPFSQPYHIYPVMQDHQSLRLLPCPWGTVDLFCFILKQLWWCRKSTRFHLIWRQNCEILFGRLSWNHWRVLGSLWRINHFAHFGVSWLNLWAWSLFCMA